MKAPSDLSRPGGRGSNGGPKSAIVEPLQLDIATPNTNNDKIKQTGPHELRQPMIDRVYS